MIEYRNIFNFVKTFDDIGDAFIAKKNGLVPNVVRFTPGDSQLSTPH